MKLQKNNNLDNFPISAFVAPSREISQILVTLPRAATLGYVTRSFEYGPDRTRFRQVNNDGRGIEALSYDTFGQRRDVTDWVGPPASTPSEERGYTGHEHLDNVSLIHMNGRIYDQQLGRMASPDPFLQFPRNAQNYNRHSYVMNNPLRYTDPSGFQLETRGGTGRGGDYNFEAPYSPFRPYIPRVDLTFYSFEYYEFMPPPIPAASSIALSSGRADGGRLEVAPEFRTAR